MVVVAFLERIEHALQYTLVHGQGIDRGIAQRDDADAALLLKFYDVSHKKPIEHEGFFTIPP
jgi:hypothetical protein